MIIYYWLCSLLDEILYSLSVARDKDYDKFAKKCLTAFTVRTMCKPSS
jgi:hypothetical protein